MASDPRPASFSPMVVFATLCVLIALAGMQAHVERFITPEKGLGYALGIVGGSAMLLLLLYPARKRLQWLGPIGGVKAWFQIHMVLGIIGPLLVLFHATFRTGAANSNVALFCMLVVSGSGLVGRYFYARIHLEFYGSQASLVDLRGRIERMQQVSAAIAFVPDLSRLLQQNEEWMLRSSATLSGPLQLITSALRAFIARRRMSGYIRRTARAYSRQHGLRPEQMQRGTRAARELAFRHIDAARRVAELGAYERLFSLWHLLHLPLFFMLLIAGVVHVVSVNLY